MKAVHRAHPVTRKYRRVSVTAMLDRLGEDFEVFSDRTDHAIERDALIEALTARSAARPDPTDLH